MKLKSNHSFSAFFVLVILLSSCVSKKKYLSLQKDSNTKETVLIAEKNKLRSLNDSLAIVLTVKDSVINSLNDSLNAKLGEIAAKKEKEKSKTNTAIKKSTLTKGQECEKKSLFIYNFTKYIEWPIEFNGTEFVIGVASDDQSLKQLNEFMSDKKVSGKKIIVEKYKKGKKYNLVYVGTSQNNSFASIKHSVRNNKTLLVTDENISGSHISFLMDLDKVRYIVDKIAIEKTGLKVGQELMRYSG